MSFNVGEMVGPYRVIEQLGQGGMATVYKAYHAALDRYVAIKVLHPALLEDASFLARFQREARMVAKLDHPNIVPIFDYAEHDGRPYLVMKFVEGETLKARLAHGLIDQQEIAKITEAVGAALAYAHKQGILHRDIKPSNVLLTTDGQIYLADFGLARMAQSGEASLTSDVILGTPQYISPEQALGKKDLDAGTDIYSFGVMLYEMIVGKVPFSADTPFSVIHDHIYTPMPLPRNVNPNVPEAMERVLLKALAKERQDRFTDVPAMLDAFERAWEETRLASLEKTLAPDPVKTPISTVKPAPKVPAPSLPFGAPVQGTVVEIAPPKAEPNQSSSDVAGQAEDTGVPINKTKRRFGYIGWGIAIVLILGAFLLIPAFRQVRQQIVPFASSRFPGALTLMPFKTPGSFMELARAESRALQNTNDPKAQLRLALAYQAANLPDLARQKFIDFEKMAKGDELLFWGAGSQFGKKDAWLLSARACVDAAELHITKGSVPLAGRDQLYESVFYAFREKNAAEFVAIERLTAIEGPLGTIANIQSMFYFGNKIQAQKVLDQLKQTKPNLPEGQLLQAELSAETNSQLARQALIDLRANPRRTAWVLDEANSIERTIH